MNFFMISLLIMETGDKDKDDSISWLNSSWKGASKCAATSSVSPGSWRGKGEEEEPVHKVFIFVMIVNGARLWWNIEQYSILLF